TIATPRFSHGLPSRSRIVPVIPPSCAAARGASPTAITANANIASAHEYASVFMLCSPFTPLHLQPDPAHKSASRIKTEASTQSFPRLQACVRESPPESPASGLIIAYHAAIPSVPPVAAVLF